MKVTIILFFILLSSAVYSETPGAEPPKPAANSMEVLKKDFFDVKPDAKPAKADPRYSAGEPDYNSEQRDLWLKNCDKYKNKDLETYRKCFQDEKAKTRENLRQSFEEVERRQSLPLRNTNPLLDEQDRNTKGQDDE